MSYNVIEDEIPSKKVNINAHYPASETYEYDISLVRLNLDNEREKDINTNNGFIITKRQNIKKDLKSDDSIFSSKYGKTMQDANAFENRYSCKCGHYQGGLYNGIVCEYCHTPVKYISDNFEYFGWICIKDPYVLIHPNLFKSLKSLIGPKDFNLIIDCDDKIDEDGHVVHREPNKDNPFIGLGVLGFKDHVDEILEFYKNKKPAKIEFYNDIKQNQDKLFTHSIPVYTTQLRPYNIDDNNFSFEGNNAIYNILAAQAARVNKDTLFMRRKDKPEKQILYAMQCNYNDIYADMEKVLASKKGYTRSLIGGRFNFCSRVVIVPDPELNIDELGVPYATMIELFQQRIVNILSKTYFPSEAYKIWDRARNIFDPNIANLIESIIQSEYVGVFFNRNPSIASESIRQMRIVKMNYDYACSVPLQILSGFGADFDGDTLNLNWIINKAVLEQAKRIFNPRYAGQISRNNGMFNSNVHHQTDTMICLNSFAFLSRESYNQTQLEKINKAKGTKPLILAKTPYNIYKEN